MLRVLHMMRGLEIGGLERVVLDLIHRARREGLDHQLLLFDSRFRELTVDFHPGEIPIHFEQRRSGFDWTLAARVARHLERFDVLHAHNQTAISYAALATASPQNRCTSLVGTYHTLPACRTRLGMAMTNLGGRSARYLIAVSYDLATRLTDEGWLSARPQVIWNGVDLDRFSPTGATSGFRKMLAPSCIVVGHVGRFAPIKRQQDLAEACRSLEVRFPSLSCTFVGQGETLDAFRAAVARVPNVRWLHAVSDMASFLRTLDIFVICSEHEGCPRVLLEAMACGRAIVATAVGGIPEILACSDGTVCGRLVPPRRPDLLASAIADLADSDQLRKELGSAARVRAQVFSADRQWTAYAELYDGMGAGLML